MQAMHSCGRFCTLLSRSRRSSRSGAPTSCARISSGNDGAHDAVVRMSGRFATVLRVPPHIATLMPVTDGSCERGSVASPSFRRRVARARVTVRTCARSSSLCAARRSAIARSPETSRRITSARARSLPPTCPARAATWTHSVALLEGVSGGHGPAVFGPTF